jgi:hypothetical protein
MYQLINIPIYLLKPHEEVFRDYVYQLIQRIKDDGFLYNPILVDQNSLVILDGHHRFHAACTIGLKNIPCILVDYTDEKIITLQFWRKNISLTRQDIIRAGLNGIRYPPKTTKHTLLINYEIYPTKLLSLR